MSDADDFESAVIADGDVVDRSFSVLVVDKGTVRATRHEPKYVISGDTDSGYVDLASKFPRTTPKEPVIAFANELAKKVNATFPEFLTAVFNSSPDQSLAVKTERDIVSDKSYFVVKKNYIMHYVDKEGVAKEGMKIMGLAVKRTDTPVIVKEFLTKMLNMLMDRLPFENILAEIKIFKTAYHAASFADIGRPMAIKGLNKYETKYQDALDTENPMKGFPYHVRASMYYNMLCGPNDVKIVDGNKIRVVYISHPDMKYIAVPADADMQPAFLSDLQIDWEAQWEKVAKKINLYLVPLGFTYEEDT